MAVYLDDNEALQETVEKHLKAVNSSFSEFMSYIYSDNAGSYIDEQAVEYGQLITNICNDHPSVDIGDIVVQMAEVLDKQERDYYEAWHKYENSG